MGDLAIAAMLIFSPPGTPETVPPVERWADVSSAMQKIAIDMEILDRSESLYILRRRSDFIQDLEIIRNRRVEYQDAPKVCDSLRFPDRFVLGSQMDFNRRYTENVVKRCSCDYAFADEYFDILSETKQLYAIYDAARDARCDYYYVTARRSALKRLRDLLGDDDFRAGKLPPCVPVWRFNER